MDLSVLAALANKATDTAVFLFKEFSCQLEKEESRIRVFFRNLISKPLTWLFTLIFSPFIAISIIYKNYKNIKILDKSQKIRMLVLVFGLGIAACAAWFIATFLGTFVGFWLIKQLFGFITAISFMLGSVVSTLFVTLLQIIVFNLVCHAFLLLSNQSIIDLALKENEL